MILRLILFGPLVVLASGWALAAIWFDGPASRVLAGLLAAALAMAILFVFVRVRPARRALAGFALLFGAVMLWWLSIDPSNDRSWLPDVARLPTATIDGDIVIIANVRNFDYRGEDEYVERWETRTYDLSTITGVDLFLSYWGSDLIAHTIMSWEFADGRHLAVSIETRKEHGESYSAVRGFFRQFELYYVVADERDLVGLRTNHRGEHVYLYRLRARPDTARALLLDYLARMNSLAAEPRWYNAATQNCTTTIRYHLEHVAADNPWDWRVLVNGHIDELGYERGTVNTSVPFDELRASSEITERAVEAGDDPAFSLLIREGLPGRPNATDGPGAG